MFFKLIIFILSIGIGVFSSAQAPAVVRGVIVKYDSKSVVLSQRDGSVHIEVPRKAVPKHFKLRTGRRIHAFLDPREVIQKMKDQSELPKEEASQTKRITIKFE